MDEVESIIASFDDPGVVELHQPVSKGFKPFNHVVAPERDHRTICACRKFQLRLHVAFKAAMELLKERGMKVSGKKAELVDRILDGADHGALEAKYSDRYYRLTPKGQQELAENEYIPYLDKTGYMSIWEMNQELFRNNPDGFDYRDIVWRTLNKRSEEAALHGDVALYVETRIKNGI